MALIYNHVEWFSNWIKVLFPELDDASIRYIEQNLRSLYEMNMRILIYSIQKTNGTDSRKEKILEILEHNFINGK